MGAINMQKDLFGNEIIEDVILRDKFLEPPFSVLDSRQGSWQERKREWISRGIKSEEGRDSHLIFNISHRDWGSKEEYDANDAMTKQSSVFDPALTELMYHWFCPKGGIILDPFAGGSVRGIVAHYLGFKYVGIELRQEQVESNKNQALKILHETNQPYWICGDSEKILDQLDEYKFDFIFSCPPYFDLEIYSNHEDDLSNMDYTGFIKKYSSIISKSIKLLGNDLYAVFVVGDVRDEKGYYRNLIDHTKDAFIKAGAGFYNDCILLNAVGSASMRASKQMEASKKVVKTHQNVLVFKKRG